MLFAVIVLDLVSSLAHQEIVVVFVAVQKLINN